LQGWVGLILDLNTRFSGVTQQHYASTIPYGTSMPNTHSPAGVFQAGGASEAARVPPPVTEQVARVGWSSLSRLPPATHAFPVSRNNTMLPPSHMALQCPTHIHRRETRQVNDRRVNDTASIEVVIDCMADERCFRLEELQKQLACLRFNAQHTFTGGRRDKEDQPTLATCSVTGGGTRAACYRLHGR
jgi:hypothetical protein